MKMNRTFEYVFSNGIPLVLIIGEDELEQGHYKIKVLNENKEYEIKVEELVEKVKEFVKKNHVLLTEDPKEMK